MLSISILAIMPTAFAHEPPWDVPTYAFVTTSPDTVQVGQYTAVVMWLDKYPPTAGGLGGDRWHNFTLNITKPDGSKETLGPFTSGPVGSTFTTYTPDQVGDYTIVFSWPGQVLTNGTGVPNVAGTAFVGDYFEGSTSDPWILHVQQNPIQVWEEPPVPTGYWTLPINDANRGWSDLASNWLLSSWFRYSNFQEQGRAPNSPHILWQKPITPGYTGGILDARWPGIPQDVNDYEQPWSTPIIMNGKIYYNTPSTAETPHYGYYCIDLYTGEQLFYKNGTDNGLNNPSTEAIYQGLGGAGVYSGLNFPRLSFGQLQNYYSVNGAGVIPYLWMTSGSTWYMLDASTGNWIMSLINVPGGTSATDQNGAFLRYTYNSNTGNILCWNSSQSIPPASPIGTGQQQWKPSVGAVISAVNDTRWTQWGLYQDMDENDIRPRSGYTMNVTGPVGLPSLYNVIQDSSNTPRLLMFAAQPYLTGLPGGTTDTTFNVAVVSIDYNVAPYSPLPDKTFTQNTNLGFGVTLVFDKTLTYPLGGNRTFGFGPVSYEEGVFTMMCKETRQWFGFSLNDGSLLWGPTPSQTSWDMYEVSYTGNAGGSYAYGKLFAYSYGGVLYAYDMKTGDLLWNYPAPGIGYESPYGNYPLSVGAISDGKIYLYSTEHSPTKPLWRGSYLRCVDVNNGHEVWKLLDFNMGMGVADGYIVTGSQYDNMIYCIGKGPSKTTVTATPGLGNAVTIQGMVTDQSPGAPDTPAIADGNMEAWMEHLYMQQAAPTDAIGVPVTIYITDPNGATNMLTTLTTDISGHFVTSWTPSTQGAYVITAAFDGTNSYGSSSAVTGIAVGAGAASPGVSPTPGGSTTAPTPPSAPSPVVWYVAIAAAVIIIAIIAAAVVLRRRQK
jgi:outer membrane protein assembly factor BamB